MTEAVAALEALGAAESPAFDEALTKFYERWRTNPLVIDKWFAVQASSPRADALARVIGLLQQGRIAVYLMYSFVTLAATLLAVMR